MKKAVPAVDDGQLDGGFGTPSHPLGRRDGYAGFVRQAAAGSKQEDRQKKNKTPYRSGYLHTTSSTPNPNRWRLTNRYGLLDFKFS
jgi:hypothetical protein